MEQLASAYDQARNDSTQVPIFAVYQMLVIQSQKSRFWRNANKEAFAGIGIEQFKARLTKALADAAETYPMKSGRHIRLLPPLDPRDAVFIYLPFRIGSASWGGSSSLTRMRLVSDLDAHPN